MNQALIEAIAVTAELTGTTLSEAAARAFASDLSRYPIEQVLPALDRCRRELKGRLTLADVVTRLEDGRPGPEEAWAMMPRDEGTSVVWTAEMAEAFGVVSPLIEAGDLIAARMAFLEQYRRLAQKARDSRKAVQWTPSLGHDKSGRELVILDAIEKNRLTVEHAKHLLPYHRQDEGLNGRLLDLARRAVKQIEVKELRGIEVSPETAARFRA